MKYIYLISFLLSLCLFGCLPSNHEYVIGVSQCSDDAWRSRLNQEMLREVLLYDHVKLDIRTANDNNDKQKSDIQNLINKKVDLLIVAPNEAAPITTVVEKAMDAGIPVIVVDRKILSDKYTAYIGADNYEIGKEVGYYLANLLNGTGNIVELKGLSGSSPAIERHLGFISALSHYPDIQLLDQEDAGWNQQPAHHKMDSILVRFSQIDAVFAHNDRMALGAYLAAREHNRHKEITFIGIDALPGEGNGIELVRDSILHATFIYPTNGDKVIQTAMNILNKKEFSRETTLHTAAVDPTNAHIMHLQNMHISELDGKIGQLNEKINSFLARYNIQKLLLYSCLAILLLVMGLLLVLFRSLKSKNRLNMELSLQKAQLEKQRDQLIQLSRQLEEATHAKLVFFTNISHDFRTPLTLVADPIDQLLQDRGLSKDQNMMLTMIKKNVNILLRLVNQVLDFRKYENGKIEYNPTLLDLERNIREWNLSFQVAARKKAIHFKFDTAPATHYRMNGDLEKIERIYFNLLSNAFKFTPENGRIHVSLSVTKQEELQLTVTNTGSEISAEHIQCIFDRFYTIDMHHSGSGIGLALTKAFVELHGGTISVESDPQTGTSFIVRFIQATPADHIQQDVITTIEIADLDIPLSEESVNTDEQDLKKTTLLIIDDNMDIRNYIRSIFEKEYAIIEAANGSEGIQKAMRYVPDLIISDIMMPGIDGVECCKRLKNQIQTCHIPVILLTACTLDEQRISGYKGGADSYISKPFSTSLLTARVKNLIESHSRLKQVFADQPDLSKEDVSDMDYDFINRFKSVIQKRMSDSELNIDVLVREMGMSRVQLYRKVKSLTNYSPNEFIRLTRLKKASALLTSSDMTVAEIGYQVGFSSPSYFTKCYKEHFGESPSDFLKNKNRIIQE